VIRVIRGSFFVSATSSALPPAGGLFVALTWDKVCPPQAFRRPSTALESHAFETADFDQSARAAQNAASTRHTSTHGVPAAVKLVTYQSEKGPRVAAMRSDGLVDLNRADASLPVSMKALVGGGQRRLDDAAAAAQAGEAFDPATVKLLPPVPAPEKVICVGLNYADHAAESGQPPPSEPVLFCKFPSALIGHGDAIVLPPDSKEVDYEAELVVVIGEGGRRIKQSDAMRHVAGYCCGHDVSARDWQLRKPGGQWLMGKTFDTFAPCGPHLVTPDEVGDPGRLRIQLRLNGQVMQDSTTAQLIFGVAELISYISRVCTLRPGDLLFTGTPPGVGMARKPPVFLKAGDVAEVEIEKVGVLRNAVVGEDS